MHVLAGVATWWLFLNFPTGLTCLGTLYQLTKRGVELLGRFPIIESNSHRFRAHHIRHRMLARIVECQSENVSGKNPLNVNFLLNFPGEHYSRILSGGRSLLAGPFIGVPSASKREP